MNGIGGRTVAEAKANMSHEEATMWTAYITKRGSLNVGRRLEWAGALLAVKLDAASRVRSKMSDYMQYEFPPSEDNSIEAAFGLITAMARGNSDGS